MIKIETHAIKTQHKIEWDKIIGGTYQKTKKLSPEKENDINNEEISTTAAEPYGKLSKLFIDGNNSSRSK